MENLTDKNPATDNGWTPLHDVALNDNLEICKLICENIDDKNPSDALGQTPISLANALGRMEIVAFLEEMCKVDDSMEFTLGI